MPSTLRIQLQLRIVSDDGVLDADVTGGGPVGTMINTQGAAGATFPPSGNGTTALSHQRQGKSLTS